MTTTGSGTKTVQAPLSAQLPLDLKQIVRREAPALLAYLSRRTANPADAADLLGDVLVVIWRRIDAMPPEAVAARMWMFGIARKVRSQAGTAALTDGKPSQIDYTKSSCPNQIPPSWTARRRSMWRVQGLSG